MEQKQKEYNKYGYLKGDKTKRLFGCNGNILLSNPPKYKIHFIDNDEWRYVYTDEVIFVKSKDDLSIDEKFLKEEWKKCRDDIFYFRDRYILNTYTL